MTQTDMELEIEFHQERNKLMREYLNLCMEENQLLREKAELLAKINIVQSDSTGFG